VERALEATFDLELVTTESRGHATLLAREAVRAGAKTVIVYGGDGTMNEVVNGLVGPGPQAEVTLAVLPGGGTNVLARSLGYPNDLVEATAHLIDLVERGSTHRMGVGRLRATGVESPIERIFTFGAGLALDADTVRRVEASGLRPKLGDLAFVWCATRAFFALRSESFPALVCETDQGPVDAWWACLGNIDPFTYLGNRPFRAVPGADAARGLDLVAGRSTKTLRTIRWVAHALRTGKHVDDPQCLHLADQAEIRIRTRRPVPLQADGEFLGEVGEVRATAVPGALPVWA
jgi:diacylglycerol kinase family enzyme